VKRFILRISTLISCILVIAVSVSCTDSSNDGVLTNNAVTRQPNDNALVMSGLLEPMSLDDLIDDSICIIIGKVVQILQPIRGTDGPDIPIIFTDIVIEVKQRLFGQITSGNVAIRALGGRIGNEVVLVEDQPIFTVGEEVLVFLSQPTTYQLTPVPGNFHSTEYFKVTGAVQGKWDVKDGVATDSRGNSTTITDLATRIDTAHLR